MLFNHRVIHGDNGTLRDYSRAVNQLFGDTTQFTYVVVEDYLYIGGDLPFTHRYFKLGATKNAIVAAISEIANWDGTAWVPAVDIQDNTSVGGATLARSGVISWTTERTAAWNREATTENMTGSGLTTAKIYDLYWVRMKFNATLTPAVNLEYVGHCFSDDAMLAGVRPDLVASAVKTAFQAGKTDWVDQHVLAAEEVIRWLQSRREIWSPNQIFNWERWSLAGVYKCAAIIYSAFPSEDMDAMRKGAEAEFAIKMNQAFKDVDKNTNGKVETCERRPAAGMFRV